MSAQSAAIRTARPTDARQIAEVHVASWIAAYTGLLPQQMMARLDVAERERAWRERLANADALQLRVWVAVLDEEVVGFAFTQPSKDHDLGPDVHELTALYLLPSVWRRGIGTALLSVAERGLRKAGIRMPALWVLEGNDSAQRFYEARGWTFEKRDPSFRDFGAAALRYRKTL
jgi:GNAT superfamily N-acetyltransferase